MLEILAINMTVTLLIMKSLSLINITWFESFLPIIIFAAVYVLAKIGALLIEIHEAK